MRPSFGSRLVAAQLFLAMAGPFAAMAALGMSGDQQRPIPDVGTLMRQVQAHQRELDKTRENYTYRELQTVTELDRTGHTKKVERRESDISFVNAHRIERLVAKDGSRLSAADQAREDERVKKDVEKAERTSPGNTADDKNQISIDRLLAIDKFSNARRLTMDHRSVLAFDYAGDPAAHVHGVAENASKRVAGTIWIDEQDRQVRRVEGTLYDSLKMGLGLFAISKGSSFSFDQKLVNNELWLPTSATVHIEARAVAFIGYRANVEIVFDNYQRFRTDSQQQGGVSVTH